MTNTGIALVAHSGGPTAVINASLVGIIDESRRRNACKSLYGSRFGLEGVLGEDFVDLYAQPGELLQAIARTPGSVLGTSRYAASTADIDRILGIFMKYDVRSFYYTGGNGSMGTAEQIHHAATNRGYELQVIGVPKTIDNDLFHTDHTPGFPSAARFFALAVRDIGSDNRALPNQVEIVEILGRNAGWLAAATAFARHDDGDAPHLIYFPEERLSLESYLEDVNRVFSRLKRCIVVVCEGQLDETGEPFGADVRSGSRGSLAQNLAHRLALLTTQRLNLRARSEKPGLLGRSTAAFTPPGDRDEAMSCGRAAVVAAMQHKGGSMVTLECARRPYRSTTGLVALSAVAFRERTLPREFRNEAGNDVTLAYLDYAAPLLGEIERHPRLEDNLGHYKIHDPNQ
jgi:6-phosphofructokinase